MIAVDSSTFIAFIQGDEGRDVELLELGLVANDVTLPPAVLTELLSEPALPAAHRATLLNLPVLAVTPDYWVRAAATRAIMLSRKLRGRLADTLIVQSCIDNDVSLITRDKDFRHFAKHCGLKLA